MKTAHPDDHVVLPETISKEPLVRWCGRGTTAGSIWSNGSHFALLNAEELGVSSANVEEMRKSRKSRNPPLLGWRAIIGAGLGLTQGLGGPHPQGCRQLRRGLRAQSRRGIAAENSARPQCAMAPGRAAICAAGQVEGAVMTAGQIRSWTIQAAVAVAVGGCCSRPSPTRAPISRRGNSCFLRLSSNQSPASALNQSFIPYSPLSSYGRALLVGLVNTWWCRLLAGVIATVIGFAAGFARLSRNWALARLAGLYVETVRNIPLLLQMLFWYVACCRPPGAGAFPCLRRRDAQRSRAGPAGAAVRAGRFLGRRLARSRSYRRLFLAALGAQGAGGWRSCPRHRPGLAGRAGALRLFRAGPAD